MTSPTQFIKSYWKQNPLKSILILAFVLRLVAAIFSQGYGMHDDHFVVIEEPWSWTQNQDYDGWLPGTRGEDAKPSIFSFFYPGINYITFEALDFIGIDNPKGQMFIIRLLLGLFSLLTVYYGYKIADYYANKKIAEKVGVLLALFWFMPFFSVRNLVEIVAIPPLLAGTWFIIKTQSSASTSKRALALYLFAGIITGISISIRFQSIVFIGGLGLVLLFYRKWIPAIVFGLGNLLIIGIIQGGIDYLIWGEPFATLKGYIEYNITHKNAYGNQGNYLMYLELIPGLLLPPVGLFIFIGFFMKAKKHLLLFLPTLLFIVFHTYFPNRQERFILTVIPMVIILGVIGWELFIEKSKWWNKHKGLDKGFRIFFWSLNTILLILLTFTYSKRSRVEAMYFFHNTDKQVNSVLIDDTGRKSNMMMPVMYAGHAINTVAISNYYPDSLKVFPHYSYIQACHSLKILDDSVMTPEYILFVENINLDERVDYMKRYFPNLSFEAYIEPSLTDKFMKKINPNNKNEDFYIYKTGL